MHRAFAFAVVVCALFIGARPAFAHANLLSSDPAAGAQLDSAPDAVTLTFSEQPELRLTDVEVLATDGIPVTDAVTAYGPRHTVKVGVKKLANGTYTVVWRCVSKVDGHATAGSFAFGVGVAPSAPTQQAPKAPGPDPLEMA